MHLRPSRIVPMAPRNLPTGKKPLDCHTDGGCHMGGGGRGSAGIGEVLDPNPCPCSGSQGHPAVQQKGRHLVTVLGTQGRSMGEKQEGWTCPMGSLWGEPAKDALRVGDSPERAMTTKTPRKHLSLHRGRRPGRDGCPSLGKRDRPKDAADSVKLSKPSHIGPDLTTGRG